MNETDRASTIGALRARRAHFAETARGYRDRFDAAGRATDASARARSVAEYYDLVTDFYEIGWGQCFHFAVRRQGDTLDAAIDRHEDWLASESGLAPGLRALDLGCGVGGPMRYLARKTGAHVTGVNVNATQLVRARRRADREGLGDRIEVVRSDFSELPFPNETFDVVYAIEATCHARSLSKVFSEALRVLVPGGRFVGYDWCTTPALDPRRADHARIAEDIAIGNALPPLLSTSEFDEALASVGFDTIDTRDVAGDCDPRTPWWMSLDGEGGLRALPRRPIGRKLTGWLVRVLERARIAPRGSTEVSDLLNLAADALVAGGRAGVFTPMYRWSAVKP